MNSKESGLGGHSSLLRAYQTSTPFSSPAYVLMLYLKGWSFPHSPWPDLRPAVGSTHREDEREQITRAADESFQSPSSSSSHLSRQPAPQPASASLRTTSPSYTKSYETHQCFFLAENKLFTHFITLKEKKKEGDAWGEAAGVSKARTRFHTEA